MKLITWNVNGIRASYKVGFMEWLATESPDILGMQEIKAEPHQLEPDLSQPEGYHAFWNPAERKGYSGTALFTKRAPVSISYELGDPEFDREGRTIIAEYEDFVLINAYFPNGGRDLSRVPFKLAYYDLFLKKCDALRAEGKSIIFCGDLNTAHREIDLARPKQNQQTTGFLPEERVWLDRYVEAGYVDIFRERNPDLAGAYTWWSFMANARSKNIGWRIDYFFITPDLRERVVDAAIHPEIMGSDHCPISLVLKG